MKCPYCEFEHADPAKYCPTTGKKLPERKTCPVCGEVVPAAAKFCPYCRTALGRQEQKTSAVEANAAGAVVLIGSSQGENAPAVAPGEPNAEGANTSQPETPPALDSAKYKEYIHKIGVAEVIGLSLKGHRKAGTGQGEVEDPKTEPQNDEPQPEESSGLPGSESTADELPGAGGKEQGKAGADYSQAGLGRAGTTQGKGFFAESGERLAAVLAVFLAFLQQAYAALLPRFSQARDWLYEQPAPRVYIGSLAVGIILMAFSAIMLYRQVPPPSPPESPKISQVQPGGNGSGSTIPGVPQQPAASTSAYSQLIPPLAIASDTPQSQPTEPIATNPVAPPLAAPTVIPASSAPATPMTQPGDTPIAAISQDPTFTPDRAGEPGLLVLPTGLPPAYTWAAPLKVDSGADMGVVNSLGVDSNGRVHIAYYRDTIGQKDVFYAFGEETSWKGHLPVQNDKANVGNYLSLALDQSGHPYVAYNDRSNMRIRYARLLDGQIDPSFVTDDTAVDVGLIRLIFDNLNRANILYHNPTQGALIDRRREGSQWTISPVKRVSENMDQFGLAKDPNGILFATYYRDGLWIARQNGDVWDEEEVWKGKGVGVASSLAIDAGGGLHLLTYSDPSGSLNYLTSAGGVWQKIELVDAGGAKYGAIAVDPSSGAVLIAYSLTADGSLHLARIHNGARSDELLDEHGVGERYISLVVDQNGQAHLSYYNDDDLRLVYLRGIIKDRSSRGAAVAQPSATTSSAAPPAALPPTEPVAQAAGNDLVGQIAFHSNRSGRNEIWVMNADGSNPRQVSIDSGASVSPSWSPDGTMIAYQGFVKGDMQIFVLDLASGQSRPVSNENCDEYAPSWSPDGRRLAYYSTCQGNREIWVMDADGSNPIRLTDTLENVWNLWPTWSPDGSQITFASNRTGKYWVYVMNADGTDPKALAPGCFPSFSPDGRSIVFSHYYIDLGEIYVMNSDGSGKLTLLGEEKYTSPSWSSDGERIVYVSIDGGDREIWLMNRDGSGRVQLTDNSALDDAPVWR